jgi:hypothetical protein
VEKLNLEVVRMTSTTGDDAGKCSERDHKLNVIRFVESKLLRDVFRISPTASEKGSGMNDDGISQVMRFFKDRIGKNFKKYCSPCSNKLRKNDSDAVFGAWKRAQERQQPEARAEQVAQHSKTLHGPSQRP